MTKAQKYNQKLDKIFNPELKRLKVCDNIARVILSTLEEKIDIDSCGLFNEEIVNILSKTLREHYYKFEA